MSSEKNTFGGLLTIIVVALFASSAVRMVRLWVDTPLIVASEQYWTNMAGPVLPGPIFPIGFKCLAPWHSQRCGSMLLT